MPTADELDEYKAHLRDLRGLPAQLKTVLEQIPAQRPSDGCHAHRLFDARHSGAGRTPARTQVAVANRLDRLLQLDAALLAPLRHQRHAHSTPKPTTTTPPAIFCICCTAKSPSDLHRRAIDVSLILYAEHEFNASTFTARTIISTLPDFYSAVTGGIGALRGPLHGGANEAAMELIEQFSIA